MFPLGYVHLSFFKSSHPPSTKTSPQPLVLEKSPSGEWLVKRCHPRLEQRHLEDGTSKAAPSTGPRVTRTGSPRVNPGSDGLGRSLGLVELNALGKSQETERNWLKNALQCELNQLKLGEVGIFSLRNGGCQQLLFGQIELRCVFFSPLVLMHKKGVNTRVIQTCLLAMMALVAYAMTIQISLKGLFYMADLLNCDIMKQ